MAMRTVVTTLIASLLLAAGPASAQEKTVPGDLIFEVPLNLTRLSPAITKVAVECKIKGAGAGGALGEATKRIEATVTNGEAVGDLQIIFPTSETTGIKPGSTVNYECSLLALASDPKAGKTATWGAFDSKRGAAFNVSPVPPKSLSGALTW